tara:strand:- start:653 stop:1120 length:468 start_codon:yes stop_codon:yes gene_type:complete
MKNIAALVDSLSPTQMSFYLIKEFNNFVKDVDYSPCCFYNNLMASVLSPFFSCMNISFFSNFKGDAIATSIETANLLLKTNNACNRYLYLWDMEWLRNPLAFDNISGVLSDDRISLIARSNSHKDLIENFCNREVIGVVDDWNVDQLQELLYGHQ